MGKRKKKTIWIVGAVLAVAAVALVIWLTCGHRKFGQTTIQPDERLIRPADTTFVVNGVAFKMVGVRGGVFRGEGQREAAELPNYYIGETEVTRELWCAVKNGDSEGLGEGAQMPMTEVSLDDCFDFLERLDSVTGADFYIPPYEYWLYAAYSGKSPQQGSAPDEVAWFAGNAGGEVHPVKTKRADGLGLYDMVGNAAEWTISGPDPLFIVAGGSYEDDMADCNVDKYGINHADVCLGNIGFRIMFLQDAVEK